MCNRNCFFEQLINPCFICYNRFGSQIDVPNGVERKNYVIKDVHQQLMLVVQVLVQV